jgi:hypothetical protein
MSNYARDSYRRRRQEEQMMFQRIAAEQQQIQNFLLLQQDEGTSLFIGGQTSTPDPEPGYSINLWQSYVGSTGIINFTNQTESEVKQSILYAVDEGYNLNGQVLDAFDPIVVGTQLYLFNGDICTFSGNYVNSVSGDGTAYFIYELTDGIVTSITNIDDIPVTGLATFSTVGTYDWVAPYGVTSIEYLVVGGGGGAGNGYDNAGGGGGGAGMVLNGNLSVIGGNTYSVTVGIGGTGGADARTNNPGSTGGTSIFDSIVSLGGGAGLGSRTGGTVGAAQVSDITAALGGAGSGGGFGGKGGGGAAYLSSGSNNSTTSGGAGGLGVSYDISGSSITYGKGGAGGDAGAPTTDGSNGIVNRGDGGSGGKSSSADSAKGGDGGSGIVIIKY